MSDKRQHVCRASAVASAAKTKAQRATLAMALARLGLAAAVLMIGASDVHATGPADEDSQLFLSRSDLIQALAQHNPQLREAGIVLRSRQSHLRSAASPFDWRLESGSDIRQSISPNPLTPTELRHRTSLEIYAQASRILRTGTELRLRAGQSFTEYPLYNNLGLPHALELTIPGSVIGPDVDDITVPVQIRATDSQPVQTVNVWGATVDFSLLQPLLRGASSAVIDAADHNARYDLNLAALSRLQIAQTVLLQVLNLAEQLALARADLALRLASRDLARDQLRETRAKIAAGRQPEIAELQIRQTIAQREEASLVVQRNLHELDVKLRRSLGLPVGPDLASLNPEPIVFDLPADEPVKQVVQQAMQRNPRLRSADLALDKAEFNLRGAKDLLLPRLDASAGVGSLAQDGDALAVWQRLLSNQDGFNWHLGVMFSMPLENREAEGRVDDAQLAVERAHADLDEAQAALREELSLAMHELNLAKERIRVGKVSRDLAARSADGETERHNLGLTTTFELLEAQEKLRQAEFALQKAHSDLNLARIRVLAARGELLDACGLSLPKQP